jgi:hypothetical protein
MGIEEGLTLRVAVLAAVMGNAGRWLRRPRRARHLQAVASVAASSAPTGVGGLCRGVERGTRKGVARRAASVGKGGPDGRRHCREKGERRREERERKGKVVVAGGESSPRTAASFSGAGTGSLPVCFHSARKFP